MANFLFENNTENWITVEVIKCPNPNDCKNEMGDGRYDTFNIAPGESHGVHTNCDEICWRSNRGAYKRTANRIIPV